jgi:hypothetical protein
MRVHGSKPSTSTIQPEMEYYKEQTFNIGLSVSQWESYGEGIRGSVLNVRCIWLAHCP